MTQSKNTKKALLMSMLSMLICITMLIGSTFAWFTDSVTSGKNTIIAGNLDVELYNVTGGKEDPVTEKTNLFIEGALWEPGHVEVVNLKIANLGTLALTYKLGINVASETGSVNVYGNPFKLSDYIKFALIDGNKEYGTGAEGRAAAIAAADAAEPVALSKLTVDESAVLYPKDKSDTDKPSEKYVTLVVYMPTTVDNKANYRAGEALPTIELGIKLIATQTPFESDSFGEDYDTSAKEDVITGTSDWFDEDTYNTATKYKVDNASDLIALQNAVAEGHDFKDKTITLEGDITLSNEWTPIGDSDNPFAGTFNGNGNAVKNLSITNPDKPEVGLFGTIKDATVENVVVTGSIDVNDAKTTHIGGLVGKMDGKSTISKITNEVNITSELADIAVGGIIGEMGAAVINGNDNTIENCLNKGNINCPNALCVGGITSCVYGGKLDKCVNLGEIKESSSGMTAGIAIVINSTVTNCYSLNISAVKDYSKDVIPQTTDEDMRKPATFVDFDSDVWNLVNGEYPSIKY